MEMQNNEQIEPLRDQQVVIVEKPENQVRKDRNGIPIQKGKKSHKITFIDNIVVGQQIHEIHVVECWKQFNYPLPEDDVADECCQLL